MHTKSANTREYVSIYPRTHTHPPTKTQTSEGVTFDGNPSSIGGGGVDSKTPSS